MFSRHLRCADLSRNKDTLNLLFYVLCIAPGETGGKPIAAQSVASRLLLKPMSENAVLGRASASPPACGWADFRVGAHNAGRHISPSRRCASRGAARDHRIACHHDQYARNTNVPTTSQTWRSSAKARRSHQVICAGLTILGRFARILPAREHGAILPSFVCDFVP